MYNDENVKNIFILELLELVLSKNIFEFDEKLFRQEIGAAMGGKTAQDYAYIFIAKFDQKIMQPMVCSQDKNHSSKITVPLEII